MISFEILILSVFLRSISSVCSQKLINDNPELLAHSCRLSTRNATLPAELFKSYSCAECFYYIYGIDPIYSQKYYFLRCLWGIRVCDLSSSDPHENCNCRQGPFYNLLEFAASNYSTPLAEIPLDPPLPNDFLRLTKDCCAEAQTCCEDVMQRKVPKEILMVKKNSSEDNRTKPKYCPATWDGWQCFPATESGQTYRGICPYYSYGRGLVMSVLDSNQHYSTKRCLENGQWFQHHSEGVDREWTEYGTCETSNYHEELAKYIVGLVAFGVSVMAIFPALVIFSVYRALRNHRVAIHKNLLFSFFLIGIFYIFNNVFFVQQSDMNEPSAEKNYVTCRLLFTIQLRFLRLATYMWQLNEGLYLYRLLVHSFAQQQTLLLYYFLGWVFPIIPTAIYTCVKYYFDSIHGVKHDDFLRRCWIPYDNDWIEWITYGPCIVSLAINLVLMVVIMRVLIKKLRHNPENEPAQYRKAVRATLVLLPVFGLHFFITIYRMRSVLFYDLMNRVLDGLQGFIVALIICYTNGEVLALLKSTSSKMKLQRSCQKETAHSLRTHHQNSQSANEAEQLNPLL